MAGVKGNCYLCGKEFGKIAAKNHIIKEHSDPSGQEECRLLLIEGAEDKNYWLYVDIPTSASLSSLDRFLRKIWLECCGHMSAFRMKNRKVGKSDKLEDFNVGDVLLHIYDFGSTTETLITVVGTVYRRPQRGVRLLARNIPMTYTCCKCGAAAKYIDAANYDSENPFYCENCAESDNALDFALPITNSPRMGICAYCGEFDTFTFVPKDKE